MRASFLAVIMGGAILAPFPAFALAPDEQNNVDIYRRFNAGVVNITSRAVAYDFFFNPTPTDSSGSGVILDSHGHILTNYHVVKGAQRLEVSLADRTKWPAKIVGADAQTDLAVLAIDAPPESLTVMPLGGSSSLQVGQKVLAIGNPFGLEHSLSAGIVSIIGNTIVIAGGDLITAAEGQEVNSAEELRRLLRHHAPGDIIKLDLIRRGKRGMIVEIKLGERPRERIPLKE